MLPHLAGDVSYNLVAVLKLYPELRAGEGFDDGSCQLDYFLVGGHKYNSVDYSSDYIILQWFLFGKLLHLGFRLA